MNQELLDLAKEIDDNEDAINDALEAEEFDKAEELTEIKVKLFRRLYELSKDVEDRTALNEYLNSLYEVTLEQRDILAAEHEKMRLELGALKRGQKGKMQYREVRAYGQRRNPFL